MNRRGGSAVAVVAAALGACSTNETAAPQRRAQLTAVVVEEKPREPDVPSPVVADDSDFAFVKRAIETVDAQSRDELLATRLRIGAVEADGEQFGPEWPEKIRKLKVKIDHMLVAKTREEATAFAALPTTTPHQGLAKYAEAEDYVRKALIDAKKAKNKADEAEYTQIFKSLIAESDAYAAKVITPEFIDSIPWTDLLSDDMASRWSKTTTVPGFACRIRDGVLTLSPPDPGSKQQGVIGIFDQRSDDLRHFVLDMEFAVEGVVTMFFHVSASPQNPDNRQSHTFDLVAGRSALVAGRAYRLVATYVGSDLVVEFPDSKGDDAIATWRADPSWVKLRRGGIAFLVPEGARLVVTRMRIKELR